MTKKKKVAIIGTNGLPAKYGGFETLANYLTLNLKDEFDFIVYCSKTTKEKRLYSFNDAKLIYFPFKANGWQSLLYDIVSIFHAFFVSDVLVILGYAGAFAFPFSVFFKKKIVVNIGGIEWQKVRGKKIFAPLEIATKKWFEKNCVHFSDVVIVDNQVLWNYIKTTYNINSVLAEYGGDHAINKSVTNELIEKYPFMANKYDVSVSRAQEDMNIHILIEAYKEIPERNLVVVSNWEISDYGIHLKTNYKNKYPNIFLQDSVYDLDELNAIRSNSVIYLHAHALCGTAPSLTEAMSLGLPVLCFDVETNRASTEQRSFYFKDVLSLRSILSKLDNETTIKLGKEMQLIANRRYNWKRITNLYKDVLVKLSNNGKN
jgi:glycosyltransferase involved in cell wall biosynthesis